MSPNGRAFPATSAFCQYFSVMEQERGAFSVLRQPCMQPFPVVAVNGMDSHLYTFDQLVSFIVAVAFLIVKRAFRCSLCRQGIVIS